MARSRAIAKGRGDVGTVATWPKKHEVLAVTTEVEDE